MSRILIVDDEMMVLRAMERILSGNFEVMTLLGTADLLETFENWKFDAVISDFGMPGPTTGADVLRLARRIGILGCILHSGGAPGGVSLEDVVRDHCPPGTVLLMKPASPEEILAALGQVLPQG